MMPSDLVEHSPHDIVRPSSRGPSVPAIVADAGEHAVKEYQAYFDQVLRNRNTRNTYRSSIRRFFRWAEQRGLALDTISANDAEEYLSKVCQPTLTRRSAATYLDAIRSLFRHFVWSGVLAASPLETPQVREMASIARRRPKPSIPLAELKEMVLALDESWEEDQEFFQAGLVMLSPMSLDTLDPSAISRFTGFPLPLVKQFAERMLAGGSWSADGRIAVGSDDPNDWAVSLIINVLVATGMVDCRQPADESAASSTNREEPDPE